MDVRRQTSWVNPPLLSGGPVALVLFAHAAAATGCLTTREAYYDPREEAIDAPFRAAERGDGNAQCRLVSLYAKGQIDIGRGPDPGAEAELAKVLGPGRNRDGSRIGPRRIPPGSISALTVNRRRGAAGVSDTEKDRERLQDLGMWSGRCLAEAEAGLREGRDEVLEQALREILGPDLEEAEVRALATPPAR